MNRRIDIMKIPKLSDNNQIDQFAAICGTVAPVPQVFRLVDPNEPIMSRNEPIIERDVR
jgi:hypothetical protein